MRLAIALAAAVLLAMILFPIGDWHPGLRMAKAVRSTGWRKPRPPRRVSSKPMASSA